MSRLLVFFLLSSLGFSQSAIEKTKAYLAEKKYKAAENEISTFLESNTNEKEAVELLGDAYAYQREWDKAIEQYKLLVKQEPNNANYHYKYGGALGLKAQQISKFSALGLIGDIKRAFKKAAELDKNHIDVRWALVDLYVSLPGIVGGSNSKALGYAKELEKLSLLEGYLAKGYVYEYDDELELAEKYYQLALKEAKTVSCVTISTKHRNALYYQIGKISADYNLELDKGIKCLNTYLQNHSARDGVPKAWANYRLAQIYKHQNNKEKALTAINSAIKELPKRKVFKKEKEKIENLDVRF